jgi:hypothetical protein
MPNLRNLSVSEKRKLKAKILLLTNMVIVEMILEIF